VVQGAIREAHEEAGVLIDPADLAFSHVVHHRNPEGQPRIGFFFTATRWQGEPLSARQILLRRMAPKLHGPETRRRGLPRPGGSVLSQLAHAFNPALQPADEDFLARRQPPAPSPGYICGRELQPNAAAVASPRNGTSS
jgi:hypothetical protein